MQSKIRLDFKKLNLIKMLGTLHQKTTLSLFCFVYAPQAGGADVRVCSSTTQDMARHKQAMSRL